MFRNVPECSGMFHVPDFIDARKSLDIVFVKRRKKHKSTKNLFNSIFKKCQSSGQYGSDLGFSRQTLSANYSRLVPSRYLFIPARINLTPIFSHPKNT